MNSCGVMMAWLCNGGVYIHPVFNTKQGMVVVFFSEYLADVVENFWRLCVCMSLAIMIIGIDTLLFVCVFYIT